MQFNLKTNSLFVALMLCCNSITMIPFIGKINGIVVMVVIFSFVVLLLRNPYILSRLYLPSYLLIGITILIFIINILIHPYRIVFDYFFYFLCFGIPFLLLPIHNVSYKLIIKYIVLFSFILLPFYILYDYGFSVTSGSNGFESEELMTMSYRILPLILANIIACYNSSLSHRFRLLSMGLAICYFIVLFIIGSRGALVAILLFILMCCINIISNIIHKLLFVISLLVLCFMFIISFENIIEYIYNFFTDRGINILAIDRMMFSITNGTSLDSGRSDLYAITWNNIKQSPIIGNGIGSSLDFSGYPHNLFLQVLDEGGILVFFPFISITLRGIYNIYTESARSPYFNLLSFVFCSGVIQLFFSFHYWGSQFFWAFIYLIMYKNLIVLEQNKSI